MNDAYRIRYVMRAWVGKPDPSGFGINIIGSNDPSWLHEYATKLRSNGCRIVAFEKRVDGKYVTI
jgi:hypothetical protein